MKPKIFIGSSTEGLPVAKRIKKFFESDYDCHIWNEGVFQLNEGYIETLLKSASLFDFGFMVFAADDISKIRDREYKTTRDNVLFEYGLFLGRMGLDKAFIITENGVKIPSDLHGITILSYTTQEENGVIVPDSDFERTLSELKDKIKDKMTIGHYGLMPSTVIAISYFDNFVRPLVEELMRLECGNYFNVDNRQYNFIRFRIVVPKTLDADVIKQAKLYFKKTKFELSHFYFPLHSYNAYTKPETIDDKEALVISDMPTILNVVNKAIDAYFRVGHIGKMQEQKSTEEKELYTFTKVLSLLIYSDTYCREVVEIIDEEGNAL